MKFDTIMLSKDLDSDNKLARNSARLTIKLWIAGLKDGGFISNGDKMDLSNVPKQYVNTVARLVEGAGLQPYIGRNRIYSEPEDCENELSAVNMARKMWR